MAKTKIGKASLVIIILVLSMFLSILQVSLSAKIAPENNNQFSSSPHQFSQHKLSTQELQKLKTEVGTAQNGQSSNSLVAGFGTGYAPPTEEEWTEIAGSAYSVESVGEAAVPAAIDLSTTQWFPPIGNQANQGSCVAWAVGYYVKTFQEAKEHNWDLSGAKWEGGYAGYPTASYQNKIMSPAFLYNLVNGGSDSGTSFWEAINVISGVGDSSWQTMPYNRSDYTSWPSEAAWNEAPYSRAASSNLQYLDVTSNSGIATLKELLATQNLAVIAIDANKYANLTSNDVWTTDNYVSPATNHANTIVGYDDNFAYTEAGMARYGAFKVANSWGVGFSGEHIADGFYWISYEALKQRVWNCDFYYDLQNYQPSLLAKFQINHNARSECTVTVGLGTATSQIKTKCLNDYVTGGNQPFCANNIVLDITEFKDAMAPSNQPFFLKVYDGGTVATGSITYFAIQTSVASGTPIQTIQGNTVYLTTYYPPATATLTATPNSGPPQGAVAIGGDGYVPEATVTISWQNPQTSTWTTIGSTTASTQGSFTYNTSVPDLKQSSLAGDHPAAADNIVFRAQDINGQSAQTTYQQMRRGLTRIGNLYGNGVYGNNSDLTTIVYISNGKTLTLAGKWFCPGTAIVLLDSATLGTVPVNANGAFSTTVTIPTVTPGKHTVTVRDAGCDFCVAVTRLPTVANDYVDKWHTSDFNITLTPEIPLTVLYKINYGPTQTVQANGYPTINIEDAANRLEYWGEWNYAGTTIQLPSTVISPIRLDKTPPVGSIDCGSTTTSAAVTLSLSASDAPSGVASMRFSNDGTVWSNWEPYATSKVWSLQGGSGPKTVYVQYLNNAGLTSQYSISTVFDPTGPSPTPTPTNTAKPDTPTPDPTDQPTSAATSNPTQTTNPTAAPIPEFSMAPLVALLLLGLPFSLILKRKLKTALKQGR